MPEPGSRTGRRRLGTVVVAVLLASVVLGGTLPAATAAKDPPGTASFLRALGKVESGGRYKARNPTSGAYGKYQILPSMWRAWARRHLHNVHARPTPANQERLARAVVTAAYRKYGSWRVVAHYWLTGRGERDSRHWSRSARRYVARVMHYYRSYGGESGMPPATGGTAAPPRTTRWVNETSAAIDWSGTWATASHRAYSDRRVRWSSTSGASATFTFTGSGVTWLGPKGPTRGRARVSIDGKAVATIDLRAARFRPRERLYSTTFGVPGRHTITIEVMATGGRRIVAIDAFLIRS